ncbi:SDR family oxidoreductase [Bacillus cereus]|uniref:SDR family NAD(P)-dependent oxidoreductase n=2 Tax=Bacillus cereus group TaxID=86661 RepID=A0A9W7PZT4_BACCE|nr:SDR family oxidoreductase [Bacillus cereus]KAA6452226.1 SDR family NAD(P)-dependent oxidoreductase [Bacillus cereus]KAB2423656.1 SDR family oxidoreductase [Bacillus cereus]KAB2458497.1 SDR family oxidoreductase [Bacillus cereus]KAB2477984.1 SDR family oxidoreductase [Bacillus cereus]KAB2502548.1 SDR family oxidoreductase [Bacillus cereus]
MIKTFTETQAFRVALVIGGSGGIGHAIVKKLVENGFAVAVHYSGNKLKAETIVNDIINQGGKAISIGGDVADEKIMQEVFNIVEEKWGGIDVVINTAGIMLLSSIADMNLADLDKMYRTNIRGAFVISQQAARRVRKDGAIINFSTSVTRTKFLTYGAYVASKAAVESVTMILARELRGKDITVNVVAPGPTATPLFLDGKDEQTINNLSKAAPLERLGAPEDIADTVMFLVTSGRWINGQVIFSNGGLA